MVVLEHLKQNALTYFFGVFMSLAWMGFLYYMDGRHEAKGAVAESDLREIRREIANLETYQELAPNTAYSEARTVQLKFLKMQEKELQEELQK